MRQLRKTRGRGFRANLARRKLVVGLSACAMNCDVINMSAITDTVIGARSASRKAQGGEVERRARIVVGKNKKNRAIVRVCQLRIIGWLKLSPPVPS